MGTKRYRLIIKSAPNPPPFPKKLSDKRLRTSHTFGVVCLEDIDLATVMYPKLLTSEDSIWTVCILVQSIYREASVFWTLICSLCHPFVNTCKHCFHVISSDSHKSWANIYSTVMAKIRYDLQVYLHFACLFCRIRPLLAYWEPCPCTRDEFVVTPRQSAQRNLSRPGGCWCRSGPTTHVSLRWPASRWPRERTPTETRPKTNFCRIRIKYQKNINLYGIKCKLKPNL